MGYKYNEKNIERSRVYNQTAYERINIYFPRGERENIKRAAAAQGESQNEFCRKAIAERMEKLGGK